MDNEDRRAPLTDKTKPVIFHLHTLEWFKENMYEDSDGDFWLTAELRAEWDAADELITSCIFLDDIEHQHMFTESEIKYKDWGFVETPETHPQYYI